MTMQPIRPWLLIGKYRETLDSDLLARAQVGALLHLAARVEPPDITTLYLPVEDGEPLDATTLRRGVDFILAQRAAGKTVLVACGAGISRSTTFAIAALKEAEGLSLLGAARAVRRLHANGLPHMALWSSLCAHYGEPDDYMALIRTAEPESEQG
ncbi:dual specificity protein phosphatase family protein [Oscillochloris sp. ZM17-4]|uniref:dual specificity protein phosphatase family protein n=1 Tax=Oscillochloris sp. ZM17-4 TaxID=2866714 RepID=UPI001C72A9D6|nr:dual specificity protein phosphatase [Oscillochloris sp. ZM17-4]MBX0328621.1 dual specificity protein phosphatase family protein [Oscillochloris sp. ZM17-4]